MTTRAMAGPGIRRRHIDIAEPDVRLPGLLLCLLGAAFITVTMLLASAAPAYDYNGAAISDLGVIDRTAPWFNALLVAMGVLNVAGGYLYFRAHRRAWLMTLYAVAGLGTIGAGLFPLSAGEPHAVSALVAFLFYNFEALGTATVIAGPVRILGYLAGVVGLLYTGLMVLGDSGNPDVFGPIGHGGVERMIAYPTMLWLVALGGYLMRPTPSD